MGKHGLEKSAQAVRESLTLLDVPATDSLQKVPWDDVKKLAEQVSKHATTVGLLGSKFEDTVEAVKTYLDTLQGLVLLSHGSTVGAGPTLLAAVRENTLKVVETSLSLLDTAMLLACRKASDSEKEDVLPTAVGKVWDACKALQKVPTDNRAAVGRSIIQVIASMQDVTRELDQVRESALNDATAISDLRLDERTSESGNSSSPVAPPSEEALPSALGDDEASGSEDMDFGQDLSDEEMGVVKASTPVVDSLILVLKQVVYVVADKTADTPSDRWEGLLACCKTLGLTVEELGSYLYPPQDLDQLQGCLRKLDSALAQVQQEVLGMRGSLPESLRAACDHAQSSHVSLKQTLDAADPTLE